MRKTYEHAASCSQNRHQSIYPQMHTYGYIHVVHMRAHIEPNLQYNDGGIVLYTASNIHTMNTFHVFGWKEDGFLAIFFLSTVYWKTESTTSAYKHILHILSNLDMLIVVDIAERLVQKYQNVFHLHPKSLRRFTIVVVDHFYIVKFKCA